MASPHRTRAVALTLSALVASITLLATSACGVGEPEPRPPDLGVAPLRHEAAALRIEIAALQSENRRLREAILGPERWSGAEALDPAGGPGGYQYLRACPAGLAVSGFRGTHGAAVDSLVVVCSQLQSPAGPDAPSGVIVETELDPIGGLGGERFDRACPAGEFIVELRGRADDHVTRLQPVCRPLEAPAGGTGSSLRDGRRARRGEGSTLIRIGGSSGAGFTQTCDDGQIAIGLSGHSGRVIDSIALHCAPTGRQPTAEP